jgi:hypothetical protein
MTGCKTNCKASCLCSKKICVGKHSLHYNCNTKKYSAKKCKCVSKCNCSCLNIADVCCDEWTSIGGDESGRSFDPCSKINPCNVDCLESKFNAPLGSTVGGSADTFVGSVVVDQCNIYVVTHNQRDESGSFLEPDGRVICISRCDGSVNWSKKFSDYTSVSGDYSRGIALYGDWLYTGVNTFAPQTWSPFTNVRNRFSSQPWVARGERMSMLCINKHTGNLVWKKYIGKEASKVDDEDNFLMISASPIVFETCMSKCSTSPTPILAFGTSSIQSFVPWLVTADEVTKGVSIGSDPKFRMTDNGHIYLLNACTGEILVDQSVAPERYQEGDELSSDSVVNGDSEAGFKIWHNVCPEDLDGGELDPIDQRYGESKYIQTLAPGGTILAGSPLVGLTVTGNDGSTVGPIVAGGVPSALENVTFCIDVVFEPGTTTFHRVGPIPGGPYDTTSSDMDGVTGGNFPARIVKVLQVGDTLTEQDAYQSNYYGSSTWASPHVVNRDSCGCAAEIYFTTGQSHATPLDEQCIFDRHGGPGTGQNYLDRVCDIQQKQDAFKNDRTKTNFLAVREAWANAEKDVKIRSEIPVSVRGNRNFHNSVIGVNLRCGSFGDLMWNHKVFAYDTWHVGFRLVMVILVKVSTCARVLVNVVPIT